MKYYLGIDIGASSGRHILGHVENGKILLEEVYRFETKLLKDEGHLYWDVDHLYREVIAGIKRCGEIGKIPTSLSIDSFAVDYVLLDEDDKPILPMYAYRDDRGRKRMQEVEQLISDEELYQMSGIQKQHFNTIYQLYDDVCTGRMAKAKTFLMLPDYLQFLLSGVKHNEYTNATSSALVSAQSKTWNEELMERLHIPAFIFKELSLPQELVGPLSNEVAKEVGFTTMVVHCASHDTASAVCALPYCEGHNVYISSGTWSLMGIESEQVDTSELSRLYNFTNEGGIQYRFRHLKNIMGLWMIQNIRHELDNQYTFAQLAAMAKEYEEFKTVVDVDDRRFLAPKSMMKAIDEYCEEHQLIGPTSVGEYAALVYRSLAVRYAKTLKELEKVHGCTFDALYIIGGGSQAEYLNELSTKYMHVDVYAGIPEATVVGNILVQLMSDGVISSLNEGREMVRNSFVLKKYLKGINNYE